VQYRYIYTQRYIYSNVYIGIYILVYICNTFTHIYDITHSKIAIWRAPKGTSCSIETYMYICIGICNVIHLHACIYTPTPTFIESYVYITHSKIAIWRAPKGTSRSIELVHEEKVEARMLGSATSWPNASDVLLAIPD